MRRYAIDSLWALPMTATALLVHLMLFPDQDRGWVWILMMHGIATWMSIAFGPPFYRHWFMGGDDRG